MPGRETPRRRLPLSSVSRSGLESRPGRATAGARHVDGARFGAGVPAAGCGRVPDPERSIPVRPVPVGAGRSGVRPLWIVPEPACVPDERSREIPPVAPFPPVPPRVTDPSVRDPLLGGPADLRTRSRTVVESSESRRKNGVISVADPELSVPVPPPSPLRAMTPIADAGSLIPFRPRVRPAPDTVARSPSWVRRLRIASIDIAARSVRRESSPLDSTNVQGVRSIPESRTRPLKPKPTSNRS